MNDSNHSEELLFQKCLELPPEKREAFVESSCGEDTELRDRVLQLLCSHEKAGGFFDSLVDEDSAAIASRLERIAPSEESAGDQIGRYKLLEQLGEGAWGTVWMAQQVEDIDRRVALKILKLGLDTKDFLARFEAERQMLAMMDHPNIARVIDAGATDYGRPYMVMELVKGMPLLEYADKNRLNIAERVELFTKVCTALQHAHEKGVIHRDLKPSNILVSRQGDEVIPKVIDFGVAKSNQFNLTDKTLFTSIHTFIGTPVYSSPEQLEFTGMDVDPRSDVYSLGALLYELICGQTPFDYEGLTKEGIEAFRTIIREKDSVRPSQRFGHLSPEEQSPITDVRNTTPAKLSSTLTNELDWISMKCLEKDRSRRYDSAELLAADLQAYLDGKSVSAAAPSATYRIRKYITRKRPTYAIGLEVAAVLLAALALFFFFRTPLPVTPDQGEGGSSPVELVSSIAVLPLISTSSDEENLYFADGVHEDILVNLSRIDGLDIVSRATMLRYTASDLTLREIGRDLNVNYIVAGTVRRIANHVRVSVQLVDALNDRQIWANNFQKELATEFATQNELAKEISNSIHLKLQPETVGSLSDMPTSNVLAYDLYIKSIDIEKTDGETEASTLLRRSMLEQAVHLDPQFVEAWAILKRVYALMARRIENGRTWYQEEGREPAQVARELRDLERRALEKAISLNSGHPETRLAQVVDHDWPKSEEQMQQMKQTLDGLIEANPNFAMAWYHLAWWYYFTTPRNFVNCTRAFEEALKRDPFNARIVRATLARYSDLSDRKNVSRLLERLDQIVSEKDYKLWGTDVDVEVRLSQIRIAFYDSADETLLEEYKRTLLEVVPERNSRISMANHYAYLWTFTNETDKILDLASELRISQDWSEVQRIDYVRIQLNAVFIHLYRGDQAEAESIASDLIRIFGKYQISEDFRTEVPDPNNAGLFSMLTVAHVVIGERSSTEELLNWLADTDNADISSSDYFLTMAWLDPSQCIQENLNTITEFSDSLAYGEMAANYYAFRLILEDPDIVDYYVGHGKWLPYLAKRSPVYAKFLDKDSSK